MTLIERLEALTGPCRECDSEILCAAFGWVKEWSDLWDSHIYTKDGKWNGLGTVPKYTASIDAAMKMVPEGHSWMLSVGGGSIAQVTDCTGDACAVPKDYDAHAATPAIALCSAALKARQ